MKYYLDSSCVEVHKLNELKIENYENFNGDEKLQTILKGNESRVLTNQLLMDSMMSIKPENLRTELDRLIRKAQIIPEVSLYQQIRDSINNSKSENIYNNSRISCC